MVLKPGYPLKNGVSCRRQRNRMNGGSDVYYDVEVKERKTQRDKSDRATAENVLDLRTRMLLFKLLSRGILSSVEGCISTGKEANIYHGVAADSTSRAIKVYKTSILTFKDRDKYISGEYRYRHGYCKKNPRKMVSIWAEKEFRNLKRMRRAGILCPEPLYLKRNVLMMEFIESGCGVAAPLLREVDGLNSETWEHLYLSLIKVIRIMYHVCSLVHSDLSEYNILYTRGQLCIIDVSQSVEREHPDAFEFLRKDLNNINIFFEKRGVCAIVLRDLFDFIIDTAEHKCVDSYLSLLIEKSAGLHRNGMFESDKNVFLKSFIPQNLGQIKSLEEDLTKICLQETDDLLYRKLVELNMEPKTPEAVILKEKRSRLEKRAARRENKRAVKEDRRLKRMEKKRKMSPYKNVGRRKRSPKVPSR